MQRLILTFVSLFIVYLSSVEAQENVKIAIAGDSTVSTYDSNDIAGWGQYINLFLKDNCKVYNNAVGGRSTKTFIEEGRWDKLLLLKPQFIFLQFGHNDSHEANRHESTDADKDYKEYLRKYADDAKKISATMIFVTPVHRRMFLKDGKLRNELQKYADAMKAVSAEKNITCVDLHGSSGVMFEKLGVKGTENLFHSANDFSHFSQYGAYQIAKLISDELKENKSNLGEFIRETPLPLPKANLNMVNKPSVSGVIHLLGIKGNVAFKFDDGSDGVSAKPAPWMKKNAEQRYIITTQPATEEWTKCHLTFTPQETGNIKLMLMSSKKDIAVCYDDLTVNGAEIKNCDFEESNNNKPAYWDCTNNDEYVASSEQAHKGKSYVKCTAQARCNQDIDVTKGQAVTISFWLKNQ